MEQTCALIISSKPTCEWELLFTPIKEWLTISCQKAGVSKIVHITEEEYKENNRESHWHKEVAQYNDVIIMETNRPLAHVHELIDGLRYHRRHNATFTRFIDSTGEHNRTGIVKSKVFAGYHLSEGYKEKELLLEFYDVIETRTHLALASEEARYDIVNQHLEVGADIPLLDGIIIGPEVVIGKDTMILPGTILKGKTRIGIGCKIGPNTNITDSTIGDNVTIIASFMNQAVLDNEVSVGPMANLRPGTHIAEKAHIGDFVELKNASIGKGTSVSHLSYLGDCTVGEHCNFGCGCATVNYDGKNKHHTTIGNNAFIGCGCNLVAPLTIGDGAYTAAGSTITEDVPSEALVIARSHQVIKPEWNKDHQKFLKE